MRLCPLSLLIPCVSIFPYLQTFFKASAVRGAKRLLVRKTLDILTMPRCLRTHAAIHHIGGSTATEGL